MRTVMQLYKDTSGQATPVLGKAAMESAQRDGKIQDRAATVSKADKVPHCYSGSAPSRRGVWRGGF